MAPGNRFIEYGRVSGRLRRSVWRVGVAVLAALLIAFGGMAVHLGIVARIERWIRVQRCLQYSFPPNSTATGSPAVWRPFSPGIGRPWSVAFLHERRSPSGTRRLVVVYVYVDQYSDVGKPPAAVGQAIDLHISAEDAIPGRLVANPHLQPESEGTFSPTVIPLGYGGWACIFHGQPDETDEAHFTIGCSIDGRTEVVDGWLVDSTFGSGTDLEIRLRANSSAAVE
jgi:hypothetical protein